jgi:hypothetical protein
MRKYLKAVIFCQKIPVPDLTRHQLEECVKKEKMEVCPKCRLAFRKKHLVKHVEANECIGGYNIMLQSCLFCCFRQQPPLLARNSRLLKSTRFLLDPSQETNATVCPLCGELLEDSDDGWLHHLLDKVNGCEKNARRKKGLTLPTFFGRI